MIVNCQQGGGGKVRGISDYLTHGSEDWPDTRHRRGAAGGGRRIWVEGPGQSRCQEKMDRKHHSMFGKRLKLRIIRFSLVAGDERFQKTNNL